MEFGMFHEFPSMPGRDETEMFDEAMAQVDAAERWGLDVMWLAEIHFAPERTYLSAPLSIASAIAARTERMQIGIEPFHAFLEPIPLDRGGFFQIAAIRQPLERLERRCRRRPPPLHPAGCDRLARFEHARLSAQPRLERPTEHACDRIVEER